MKLNLNNVGCFSASEITLDGNFISIIGDNLTGKSLILDSLYLALTGTFPINYNEHINSGFKILPFDISKESSIAFYPTNEKSDCFEYKYSKLFGVWKQLKDNTPDDGIIIYALQDGSFVLWDSLINSNKKNKNRETNSPFVLTEKDLLKGIDKKFIGLNNKITFWKNNSNQSYINEFETLLNMVFINSDIKIGEPIRISVTDCIDYPIININGLSNIISRLPCGIKRIIELVFLIYLSQRERKQYYKILGIEENKMPEYIILIDDIEYGISQNTIDEILTGLKNLLVYNDMKLFLTSRKDNELFDNKIKISIN